MRQRTLTPGKTDARKKFQGFKREDAKVIRRATVNPSPELVKLQEVYEEYAEIMDRVPNRRNSRLDDQAEKIAQLALRRLDYSAEIVMDFMISMPPIIYFTRFITAMINAAKAMDFRIYTDDVPFKMFGFGRGNTKNIQIVGNVADRAFHEMKSGLVVIDGDVGRSLGKKMSGGKIIVHGDVEADSIYGLMVSQMEGGEVHIEGEMTGNKNPRDIRRAIKDTVKHGRVYHRGKLIVDK